MADFYVKKMKDTTLSEFYWQHRNEYWQKPHHEALLSKAEWYQAIQFYNWTKKALFSFKTSVELFTWKILPRLLSYENQSSVSLKEIIFKGAYAAYVTWYNNHYHP